MTERGAIWLMIPGDASTIVVINSSTASDRRFFSSSVQSCCRIIVRYGAVGIVDDVGVLYIARRLMGSPLATASMPRAAPDDIVKRRTGPPISVISAAISSIFRSTECGWVLPLSPRPRRS